MSDLNGQKSDCQMAQQRQPCMIASDSIGSGTNIGALSHIAGTLPLEQDAKSKGQSTLQMSV